MLTITLQDPNATYSQGDLVAGQVSFHGVASQPVDIVVEFTGHTKTTTPDSGDRYGQADLCWTRVAQFQCLHGSQPASQPTAWPFSFTFPSRASPVDPSVVDMRGWTNQMTTIRSYHALPPTFLDQGVPPLFMAAVEYHVRASAWGKSSRSGSAHVVLGEQSVAIVYRPRDDPGPVPLQDLKTTKKNKGEVLKLYAHRTIKSSLFVPKAKEKRVKPPPDQTGLRERARSLLPRLLHLPSLQCRLELVLPAQIHLGEEILCLVNVVPLLDSSSSSTVSKAPPFTLSAFSIAVTGKTKVWAAGESRDMDDVKSRADVILDKSKTGMDVALVPSSSSSSSPTAVAGEGNYARALIISPAVQGTAPTFKTYNIFRTYAMRVAVEVRCADVSMSMAEKVELVVLPGTGDYYSSTLRGVAGHGDFDVLDPARLPSYVESVSQMAQAVFSILGG
ncbi:hypothetical protein ASPCAL14949 [Aspergillus calidoustus]|uniref:Arrestin-like N-terminal domain-containing protein n=1 Tax=Aspergillus calidoustus TaxID=454130 RepID=A0A0U5GLX9_ASPCI|nr:hypothetical protein ASPCAL14949 [Aspergillus calidoustus]